MGRAGEQAVATEGKAQTRRDRRHAKVECVDREEAPLRHCRGRLLQEIWERVEGEVRREDGRVGGKMKSKTQRGQGEGAVGEVA